MFRFRLVECGIRHVFIWKEKSSQNNPIIIIERSRCRGIKLILSDEIHLDVYAVLYVIWKSNLTVSKYAVEKLRLHVVPYAVAIVCSFLLIDNNFRSETDCFVENASKDEAKRMEYSVFSLTLNLIIMHGTYSEDWSPLLLRFRNS